MNSEEAYLLNDIVRFITLLQSDTFDCADNILNLEKNVYLDGIIKDVNELERLIED